MEEADIRLTELKKSSYEFERDILKGSLNSRTGRVVAEKVVRYFEDKQRSRDALIEKLRLKNSTLKVQKKKLHLQLKQVLGHAGLFLCKHVNLHSLGRAGGASETCESTQPWQG